MFVRYMFCVKICDKNLFMMKQASEAEMRKDSKTKNEETAVCEINSNVLLGVYHQKSITTVQNTLSNYL